MCGSKSHAFQISLQPFCKDELDKDELDRTDRTLAVLENFQAYRNVSVSSPPYGYLPKIREPSVLADAIAPLLETDVARKQELLEASDVITRSKRFSP
jgi:hypothetical protein